MFLPPSTVPGASSNNQYFSRRFPPPSAASPSSSSSAPHHHQQHRSSHSYSTRQMMLREMQQTYAPDDQSMYPSDTEDQEKSRANTESTHMQYDEQNSMNQKYGIRPLSAQSVLRGNIVENEYRQAAQQAARSRPNDISTCEKVRFDHLMPFFQVASSDGEEVASVFDNHHFTIVYDLDQQFALELGCDNATYPFAVPLVIPSARSSQKKQKAAPDGPTTTATTRTSVPKSKSARKHEHERRAPLKPVRTKKSIGGSLSQSSKDVLQATSAQAFKSKEDQQRFQAASQRAAEYFGF
jgi:hypothetical protein